MSWKSCNNRKWNENAIQEEEFLRQEEEMARKKVGLLAYDGYLEKKSPAHNLWQVKKSYIFCSVLDFVTIFLLLFCFLHFIKKRYFKLTTRNNKSIDKSYTLMWYKKEGDAVLKALDIERIQSVSLICSNRPLVYLSPPKHTLVLQSEPGNNNKDILLVQPLEHEDNASGK
jgi:hypothetical protein